MSLDCYKVPRTNACLQNIIICCSIEKSLNQTTVARSKFVLREVLKLVYSTYVYNFTASMHRQTNEYLHWYSKWENSNICDIYLCNMHLTFVWPQNIWYTYIVNMYQFIQLSTQVKTWNVKKKPSRLKLSNSSYTSRALTSNDTKETQHKFHKEKKNPNSDNND